MMRFFWLIGLALVPAAGRADGPWRELNARQTGQFWFENGVDMRHNDVVARASFRSAAEGYEGAMFTPNRLRMQANARILAGDIPQAIFLHRRGLSLDANDVPLHRGLEYARTRVAYSAPDEQIALMPRSNWAGSKLMLRRWGLWLITPLSVFAWFSFARWNVTRQPRWLRFFVVGLLMTGLISTLWLMERYERKLDDSLPVAVVARPEVLRNGDGFNYLPRREAPLPAGVEARMLRHHGTWVQLELADGTVGWLPAASVLVSTSP